MPHWSEFVTGLLHSGTLRFVAEKLTHNTLVAGAYLLGGIAFIGLLEFCSGAGVRHYRTRGFVQDVWYHFWYHSGLFRGLFLASFYAAVAPRAKVFDIHLLGRLPFIPQCIVGYVLAEFVGYWFHRWQHASRFLWAFHTTHHSQEHLTFATGSRFHPVESILNAVIPYLPLLALGAQPATWPPIALISVFIGSMQHSQVRWRYGPLRWIVTSPTFHAIHHSVAPEHHNRNFGLTMPIWDYVFGTAVRDDKYPERTGLADVKMPTLWSTIRTPFELVRRFYFGVGRDERVGSAGAGTFD